MGLGSILGGLVSLIPGVGPVASGLSSAAGALYDANKSSHDARGAQANAEQYSSAEAAKNREFQERMSSSAYQRGVKDMQAAGLNPMLAYSQGPAAVPGGSAAIYPGAVGAQYKMAEASQASASAAVSQADTAASIGSATIAKTKQEVVNLGSVNEQVQAVTRNLFEEWVNLIKTGENLDATRTQIMMAVNKMGHEIPLIRSQQFLNEVQVMLTEVQTALARGATTLQGLDISAAQKFDNLGRDAQQLRPIFEILKMLIRPKVSGGITINK